MAKSWNRLLPKRVFLFLSIESSSVFKQMARFASVA